MDSIHDPILSIAVREELKRQALAGVSEHRLGLSYDVLNRQALAEVVWKRLGEKYCPKAIGLYGSWGTGKTSLLNLIEFFNQTSGEALPVSIHIERIEAWSYESVGSLVTPIVTALIGLLPQEKRTAGFRKSIQKILLVTTLTAGKIALDAALSKFFSTSTDEVKDAVKNVSDKLVETARETDDNKKLDELTDLVDTVAKTRQEFQVLVNMILHAKERKRLAIFVDDLDRCSPENVVALLESVKNFFSVDNCVWVFAMDSGVVASYIDKKYEDTRMDGNSYLDKIIPEQYHIPSPFSYDLGGLEKLLDKIFSPLGNVPARWKEYARSPQVLVPRRLIKSASKFAEINRLKNLAVGPGASNDTVFALILLYHAWPKFYQYLTTDDENYVKGVLKHFAPQEMVELFGSISLPLPEEFGKLEDLQYFLQRAFLKDKQTSKDFSALAGEIVNAMAYLRQVGLP